MLQLALLGSPEVSWRGAAVPLARRQTRALLYRLAAEGQPVTRDQLCFLLWPDQPDATARRNLTVTLNHLRSALPLPEAVLAGGDALALNAAATQSDVAAFSAAAAAWRSAPLDLLAGAVERVRGPFLDGFALPASPEFDRWLEDERRLWERRHMEALATLVDAATVEHDYSRAIAAAERGVAVDPLAEELHRKLIALYAAAGDRAAALRQFERCVVALERELGVDPLPATRAVYEAVRDGRSPLEDSPIAARGETVVLRAGGHSSGAAPGMPRTGDGASSRSTVPAPVTPLVGREDELCAASELLRRGDARLLTLAGPGGAGKTSLAVEVGSALREQFVDGVVWVPLAPLRDHVLVADAIVQACGLQQNTQAPREQLCEYVRDKQLLLVLDNFEHLLPAVPLLADLLAAGPHLRLLVTSRTLLNVQDEHLLPVPPLPLPVLDPLPPLDALTAQPALALLLARARQHRPSFQLNHDNAAELAAVCVRLDGLPLAIELAAARLTLLSPRELLRRLDHRLPLLEGRARDLPERQRTMRAVLDWSERLLGRDAQQLLAQLAVFAGGWTLPAAEAVCAAGDDACGRVLDGLAELLGANLIARQDGPEGETRFTMLEIVREYALERLREHGRAAETAAAHARYYRELAEQAVPLLHSPDPAHYLRRLDAEHANLLVALETLSSAGEVESGLRCASALGWYWMVRGFLHGGRGWIERLLAAAPDEAGAAVMQDLRARAYETASRLAFGTGEYAITVAMGESALAIRRALGDRRELARALLSLSADYGAARDWQAAAGRLAEGAALAQNLHDREVDALLTRAQARLAVGAERFDDARAGFERCLAWHREQGEVLEQIVDLFELSSYCLVLNDDAAAQAYAAAELDLARRIGWGQGMAVAQRVLGDIARLRRDTERAEAHYCDALRQFRAVGNRRFTAKLQVDLGELALERGDVQQAWDRFRACRDHACEDEIVAAAMLRGLAVAAALDGQPLRAARWWGAAGRRYTSSGWVRPAEYEHTIWGARDVTGERAFSSALAAGRGLTIAQAIVEVAAS